MDNRGKVNLGKAVIIEQMMEAEMADYAIMQADGALEVNFKEKVSTYTSQVKRTLLRAKETWLLLSLVQTALMF